MADWVAIRSAVGSLGTGTQGVVALSLIVLPAQVAGTVYIEKVYSSPGAGDGSNCRFNAECAVIRNGDSPHIVTGGDRAGCGGSPPYGQHPPVASWQAGNGVGQEDCLPRADPKVTTQSSVVWPRAETRQTPEISSTSPWTFTSS
jgi:hypothetical protein